MNGCDSLSDVGEVEGIVFERIDGLTMTEYIEEYPNKAEYCVRDRRNYVKPFF